jgi:hypothetical protein
MKIKRKKDSRHITSYTAGNVSYEFKGKGPFEIEDTHFHYLQDYFEKVEEKKPALSEKPEKQEVPNG